jgi:Predicted ATP-dependent serine protease
MRSEQLQALTTIEQLFYLPLLEKRGNLMLQNQDAYLTATGGIKLNEPAIDLAIVMAVASSYTDKEISPTDCFVGEVGLTGEVRRVDKIDARVKEAAKVGFKRIFVPRHNMYAGLKDYGIEVIPVSSIPQALKLVFD